MRLHSLVSRFCTSAQESVSSARLAKDINSLTKNKKYYEAINLYERFSSNPALRNDQIVHSAIIAYGKINMPLKVSFGFLYKFFFNCFQQARQQLSLLPHHSKSALTISALLDVYSRVDRQEILKSRLCLSNFSCYSSECVRRNICFSNGLI